MSKRVRTPELVAQAITLRAEGSSFADIAKALGVSSSRAVVWARGVVPKTRKKKVRSSLAMMQPELVAEATRLREQGVTVDEIAKIVGVSNFTISRWTRDVPGVRCKRKPKSDDAESIFEQANYRSDSNNFPGHEARFAGHMKRIRDYMREHSEQTMGVDATSTG